MIHYSNTEIFERDAIKRLSKYYDNSFALFSFNNKNDDFDFINDNHTIGIECTLVVYHDLLEIDIYEKLTEMGKKPSKPNLNSAIEDDEGDIVAFGEPSLPELELQIVKSIDKKILRVKRRLLVNHNIDAYLCVSIPEYNLPFSASSLPTVEKKAVESIKIFSKIFVIFKNCIFVYGVENRFISTAQS